MKKILIYLFIIILTSCSKLDVKDDVKSCVYEGQWNNEFIYYRVYVENDVPKYFIEYNQIVPDDSIKVNVVQDYYTYIGDENYQKTHMFKKVKDLNKVEDYNISIRFNNKFMMLYPLCITKKQVEFFDIILYKNETQ